MIVTMRADQHVTSSTTQRFEVAIDTFTEEESRSLVRKLDWHLSNSLWGENVKRT